MNTVLGLTGNDLPLSPVFIDFLARLIDPAGFNEESWHNQLSEELSKGPQTARQRGAVQLQNLAQHSTAQAAVNRAYEWFRELVASNLEVLQKLQARYQFITVIGAPRSGGSYLSRNCLRPSATSPLPCPPCSPMTASRNRAQPFSCQTTTAGCARC